MSVVAERTELSAEEFLEMPDRKLYELIDGRLVERKVSVLSSWVGLASACLIRNHVDGNQLGWVFGPDNGIRCFADRPKLVRATDVSFVRSGRMSWEGITDGWMHIVPDFIAEVISPNDLAYEVDEKVELFSRAGVPLIWVVNPDLRTVRIIRGDGSMSLLRDGEDLSGEDVIPGFACPVASICPPTSPTPATDPAPEA